MLNDYVTLSQVRDCAKGIEVTVSSSAGVVTRRQLIDEGALLDVTRIAPDHRIVLPTAITAKAWHACGGRIGEHATVSGDKLAGRILAAARSRRVLARPGELAAPTLAFLMEMGPGRVLELELTVSRGDTGDPVATIDVAEF
jgi:hypothetical protein